MKGFKARNSRTGLADLSNVEVSSVAAGLANIILIIFTILGPRIEYAQTSSDYGCN